MSSRGWCSCMGKIRNPIRLSEHYGIDAEELDLSEIHRREIEGQLDSQEAHAERGLSH